MLPDCPFTMSSVEWYRSDISSLKLSEGPKCVPTCLTVSSSPESGCGPGVARFSTGTLLQNGCLTSTTCTFPHLQVERAVGACCCDNAFSTAAVSKAL